MAAEGGFIGVPMATAQQPQEWGFPTPSGLQLVQHGATAAVQPYAGGAPAPQAAYALQLAQAPAQAMPQQPAAPQELVAPRMRSRLRWETIVPFVAIVCFVAAVCLFISDFDAITGHEDKASAATPARVSGDAGPVEQEPLPVDAAASGATPKERIADATRLLRLGGFEEAAATLDPLLALPTPPPAALRLDARITAASARNRALLTHLTKQQSAKDWRGALVTLGQLKRLRPLSAALLADARQARAKLLLAKTKAQARARASTAAPSAARTQRAPTAGGQVATVKAQPAQPPATVPTGSMPPRPEAPNTGGAGGGVAGGPAAGRDARAGMPGL
jgi:hypothetical protein